MVSWKSFVMVFSANLNVSSLFVLAFSLSSFYSSDGVKRAALLQISSCCKAFVNHPFISVTKRVAKFVKTFSTSHL